MTVRAKFYVTRVDHRYVADPTAVNAEISLQPVYVTDGKPANAEWSKATPQGEIKMTVTAAAAVAQFELGKAYFVDFTPAD